MGAQQVAVGIVRRLVEAGYETYFAGGWVRDYLLGQVRSDIDIATAASPEEVMELFPHTFAVGAQFGVILVIEGGHQYEVSSFRKDGLYVDGRRPEHVEYATAREDVARRDFTINGMFYDPLKERVYDWVGGREDLERGVVRAIGEARSRIAEDRLRMIRAVRMAMRFRFTIDSETESAIETYADSLFPAVAMERVLAELQKMLLSPHFAEGVVLMHRLGLLQQIFPSLKEVSTAVVAERLQSLRHMPAETPLMARLAELFPGGNRESCRALVEHLRAPRKEAVFLERLWDGRALVERGCGDNRPKAAEWVRYYALPDAHLCLAIILARYGEVNGALAEHRARAIHNAYYLQRMRDRRPLVSSEILLEQGISPGPLMGQLLRLGEEIAINSGLLDTESVLRALRESPLWPEEEP